MKRLLSLAVVIIMLLSIPFSVSAEAAYALKLSSDVSYSAGNEVLVKVTLEDITVQKGITFVSFELFYDKTLVYPVIKNNKNTDNAEMLSFLSSPKGWDGVCKLDETRGCYVLSYMTTDASAAAYENGDISVTVPFVATVGANAEMRFSVGKSTCTSIDLSIYSAEGTACTLVPRTAQSAPSAPEAERASSTYVRLKAVSGLQYRCTGEGYDSYWRDTPAFDGLKPDGTYSFYCRKPETATSAASPASAPLTLTLNFKNLLLVDPSDFVIDRENDYVYTSAANLDVTKVLAQFDTNMAGIINDEGGKATSGLVGTGFKVVLYNSSNAVIDSLTVVVKGDINGDGSISAADYIMLKRCVLGTLKLENERLAAACLAGTTQPKAADYIMLKRHVLGTYNIFEK